MLWQTFRVRLTYGYGTSMHYTDHLAKAIVRHAIRHRSLEDRVVNPERHPLHRVADPLRWNLLPAESANDDYRLRLVQADGKTLPPILCVLDGKPTFYVTRETIFKGPPKLEHVLDPAVENPVPAPALETPAGVSFLHNLRVDLPPRIRERVREVPVQVRISCELRPSYPGSRTENCFIQVMAESEDGQIREQWSGHQWTPTAHPSRARTKANQEPQRIPLYDRSALAEVPRLMEPLSLKWDAYQHAHSLRVTKKFPEVFVEWLKSVPAHIKVELAGELSTLAQDAVSGQVRLDVSESEIDWFDLRVVLDVSDTTLTQEEIKLLLNAKGWFVRLEGKGWRRLQFDLTRGRRRAAGAAGLDAARTLLRTATFARPPTRR